MLSASRYILAGSPPNCSFCREPLTGEAHRRANAYFCNELCADAAPRHTQARVCVTTHDAPAPSLTVAA